MFIRLDVAAWWKKQARVHVINQQDIVVIEKDDIRHQMTRRSGRFRSSKDIVRALEPPERVGDVFSLQCIQRRDRGYESMDYLD